MAKKDGGFFLGALFGAAIAGASALLFAPKSGEELREDLNRELDDWLDRASEYTDRAVERGVDLYDAAAEATQDIKVNLKYNADQLKSRLDESTKEYGQNFQNFKDTAKDKFNQVSQDAQAGAELLKEEGQRVAGDLNAAKDIVLETAAEQFDKASDDVADAKDKAKEVVQDTKDAVEESLEK
ncbi:YtxH domain-containing protein [Eremococcus coleocola]|uniref:Late embryogenesis abundant protein n=1 Tax=Eremococcus coleocola ACS-139-V-Col8 TaxID=908337 RepID=E4KM55_9LACT|nr:YtxH domain-containing protein [Eremococcus coleocola]EFR31943.1 hypothetical protein HMPREF9257_1041 [Eremococcus coleocola ACS-139-V-Col8]